MQGHVVCLVEFLRCISLFSIVMPGTLHSIRNNSMHAQYLVLVNRKQIFLQYAKYCPYIVFLVLVNVFLFSYVLLLKLLSLNKCTSDLL